MGNVLGIWSMVDVYRAVNNKNPPLRIFELRNVPKVLIIYKKSGNFFVRFLLFTKKNRLRRAFIIYKISEAQIWALRGSIF